MKRTIQLMTTIKKFTQVKTRSKMRNQTREILKRYMLRNMSSKLMKNQKNLIASEEIRVIPIGIGATQPVSFLKKNILTMDFDQTDHLISLTLISLLILQQSCLIIIRRIMAVLMRHITSTGNIFLTTTTSLSVP